MTIDPTQPWGLAIDYAGRATVEENGHTLNIRVYDNSFGHTLERDPVTGQYPAVYVSAELSERGERDAVLRGSGLVIVQAQNGAPAQPDPTAVERAVADALADFEARRSAAAALCAVWVPAPPAPETPAPPAAENPAP
ncbi:ATP-binding protein [Streptomyces sp. NPDC048659]|uniref:ATP-binding protein n=1 Tax=Streptomyces sp. NPDC048659 TaxID=3155489 RepID=UPI00342A62A8